MKFETFSDLKQIEERFRRGVIERWIASFQKTEGNEVRSDFELTALQTYALESADFLDSERNLIVSGPPNSGKTIVAEMLMANHLAHLSQDGRQTGCIYAVPLRALAVEKWERFTEIFGGPREGVLLSSSEHQEYDGWITGGRPFLIAVAVYEKLYRWLVDEATSRTVRNKMGLLIVDELQVVADRERGPKLEMLVSLLRRAQKDRLESGRTPTMRIVGLGPSGDALKGMVEWLDASHIDQPPDAQPPVPLVEGYMTRDGALRLKQPLPFDESVLSLPRAKGHTREDLTTNLVTKVFEDPRSPDSVSPVGSSKGKRILIYAASKDSAQKLAQALAQSLGHRQVLRTTLDRITELQGTQTLELLKNTLSAGVGFHHGGLAPEERDLVESMFRETRDGFDKLDVVVSTPTLGMGVNLPADYMLFSTEKIFHSSTDDDEENRAVAFTPLEYRNFAGRAGRNRPNKPENHHGIALFLTDKEPSEAERELVRGLIEKTPEPLLSILDNPAYGLEPLSLAVLAWYQARRPIPTEIDEDLVRTFFDETLNGIQKRRLSRKRVDYLNNELSNSLPEPIPPVQEPPLGLHPGDEELTIADAALKYLNTMAVRDTLLVQKIDERFRLNPFGSAVATTGVHIRTYRILSRLGRDIPEILDKPLVALEELVDAVEVRRLYPTFVPTSHEIRLTASRLRKFFKQRRADGYELGPRAADLLDDAKRTWPPRDVIYTLMRVAACWTWMEGKRPDEMAKILPRLSHGVIATMADQLAWIVSALRLIFLASKPQDSDDSDPDPEIEDSQDSGEVEYKISQFERQLRYGVPRELTSLAQLNTHGWHRQKLMKLWEHLQKAPGESAWIHPVELLSLSKADVGREFAEAFIRLKRSVSRRQWIDDPRSYGEAWLNLVQQAIDEDARVDPAWCRILPNLLLAVDETLLNTVADAFTRGPIGMRVAQPDSDAPFALVRTRDGIEFELGVAGRNDKALDDVSAEELLMPQVWRAAKAKAEGRDPKRIVYLVQGEIGPIERTVSVATKESGSATLLLSRMALAYICSLAVSDPIPPDITGERVSGLDIALEILGQSEGILRSIRDVDQRIDGIFPGRPGTPGARKQELERTRNSRGVRGSVSYEAVDTSAKSADTVNEDEQDSILGSALGALLSQLDSVRTRDADVKAIRLRLAEVTELGAAGSVFAIQRRCEDSIRRLLESASQWFELAHPNIEHDPGEIIRQIRERARALGQAEDDDFAEDSSIAEVLRWWGDPTAPVRRGEVLVWFDAAVNLTARYARAKGAQTRSGESRLSLFDDDFPLPLEQCSLLIGQGPLHAPIAGRNELEEAKKVISLHAENQCSLGALRRLNQGIPCTHLLASQELHPIVQELLETNPDTADFARVRQQGLRLKYWMRGLIVGQTPPWLFEEILRDRFRKKGVQAPVVCPYEDDGGADAYVQAPVRELVTLLDNLMKFEHGYHYENQNLGFEIGTDTFSIVLRGGPDRAPPDGQGQTGIARHALAKSLGRDVVSSTYDGVHGRLLRITLPLEG